MPSATRQGDSCSGHDLCGGVPLITGSGDVYINGLPAGRQTDSYQTHGCDAHSPHNDAITGGSLSVRINGLPAARVGDSVSLGGNVVEGSADVRIGG